MMVVGLTKEVAQHSADVLDLLLRPRPLRYPGLRLGPSLIQSQETALAATLNPGLRLARAHFDKETHLRPVSASPTRPGCGATKTRSGSHTDTL